MAFVARRRDSPSGAYRPEWYDRNPLGVSVDWTLVVAPHSYTVRMSYTVPTGKKAMVELLEARITRITVGAAPAGAGIQWQHTPSGYTASNIIHCRLTDADTAVKDKMSASVGVAFPLMSGDKVQGRTYDLSTDGTIEYTLSYKLTQFE